MVMPEKPEKLVYGVDFNPMNIVSIVVSASVAYKLATR
jgi:hypothetical protein